MSLYIPKPRRLPSGNYSVQVQVDGVRRSITAPTEKECKRRAARLKADAIGGSVKHTDRKNMTVRDALNEYVKKRVNVLSPSTVKQYKSTINARFKSVMDKRVSSRIDWQAEVNREAALVSPKTLRNSWGLVHSALTELGISVQKVTLPQVPRKDRPFLQPEEIKTFLSLIEGKDWEIVAMLALHGLRRSEILAVKKSDIRKGYIFVRGSVVLNENNEYVYKAQNKNKTSARNVPIMIKRLEELVKQADDGALCKEKPNRIFNKINCLCRENGLPEVGFHGLRHSYASLCYHLGISEAMCMQLGGWKDIGVMRNIYTHLAECDKKEAEEKLRAFF